MKVKLKHKYIVENAGLLKGRHVVLLLEDNRGGIPGGYLVKSTETGTEAQIKTTDLMPYKRAISPLWVNIISSLIVGLIMFAIGRYWK
jgi:hypothetical protein